MSEPSASHALHIVNGDIVGDQLRSSSLAGRVLVWREIYTAGPLAVELAVRAERLSECYGVPKDEFIAYAEKQSRVYALAMRSGMPIAVWVDPDLFDHAILMKLCHMAMFIPNPNAITVELVSLPAGPYTDEQLIECWNNHRRRLTTTGIAELAAAWKAYAELDFAAIERWIDANGAKVSETGAALAFHLKRQPGEDGLGFVERLTLTLLGEQSEQGLSKFRLFARVSERCPLFGMGDVQYWHILDVMANCEPPMIRIDSADVFITEAGMEVISGKRKAPPNANEIVADNEPDA